MKDKRPRGQIIARLEHHGNEKFNELAMSVLAGIVELEPGTSKWRVRHHNHAANSYALHHENGTVYHIRGKRIRLVSGPYDHFEVRKSYQNRGTVATLKTRVQINRFFDKLYGMA